MLMNQTTIPHRTAERLAQRITDVLTPACQRIAVAGAIRREVAQVSDIDLVCIPQTVPLDLFGEIQASCLDPLLDKLVADGRLLPEDRQDTQRRTFRVPALPDLQVKLAITTPSQWGLILALRTGNPTFARRLVAQQSQGGLLPEGHWISDDRLCRVGGHIVDVPEETTLFEVIGLPWLPPQERTE